MVNDTSFGGIKSPCVKICVVDPETGWCIGCGRTRAEVAGWLSYDDEKRDAIMETLPERVSTLTRRKRRKGGAAGRKARSGD